MRDAKTVAMATRRIRLSEWAVRIGIHHRTALRWAGDGKVSGLWRSPTGRLYVDDKVSSSGDGVALYGRVSSSDQRGDLRRQMRRLRDYAAAQGLRVSESIEEIGSGLNGHRRKLVRLLADPEIGTVIVEHRDRLARFGVEYIEATLRAQGRRLLVANEGEEQLDLVRDFVDVCTSMCARIYGRRAARNRAKRAVEAAAKP